MALRALVTTMRIPVAAALRLPLPPRASRAAGSRVLTTGSRQPPGPPDFNVESASDEELLSQVELLSEEMEKVVESTRRYEHAFAKVEKDAFILLMKYMVAGLGLSFLGSRINDKVPDKNQQIVS